MAYDLVWNFDLNDIEIDPLTGDFAVENSDRTHVYDCLYSAPGDWKQFPFAGCNIEKSINAGNAIQELQQKVKTQLIADGNVVVSIKITNINNININWYRVK